MKKGIEERRNEAYTSRQDEDQSLDPQVRLIMINENGQKYGHHQIKK